MPQNPDFSGFKTLREAVVSGLPKAERHQEFRADALIARLGIAADAAPEEASGGELRKAALAKVLVGEPDILLLSKKIIFPCILP